MNTQYKGFIEPKPDPQAYYFGGGNLPRKVLQEKGDWTDSLPEGERQNIRDIETSNCVAFGATNQIEMYEFKAFGERNNYSDRWLGIVAGTTSSGNDPQKVYEAIRKYGLIPEEMLPFSDDIKNVDEYYSFKGADKEACFKAGREWLAKKDFLHQYVFDKDQPLDEKMNNMKAALKYSPLALGVWAWDVDSTGIYIRAGRDVHWTTCYAIGNVNYILDSYPPFLKNLASNFNFYYCKRISIELRNQEKAPNWVVDIYRRLLEAMKDVLFLDLKLIEQREKEKPLPVSDPIKPPVAPQYLWDTPAQARHSVRLICDSEGLKLEEKNLICQVIRCESGFKTKAVNKNTDGTADYGIIQANEFWYIGKNRPLASIDEALNNPEKCVKIIIKRYKEGGLKDWICFRHGLYTKYEN